MVATKLDVASDFSVFYLGKSLQQSTIDADIEICGMPFHESADDLVDMYVESTDEFLDYEARHSCGNYALVDVTGDEATVITSPGFAGGYFVDYGEEFHVTSTLGDALDCLGFDRIDINQELLLWFLSKDIAERFPFTTIFKHVHRIPPGTYLRGNGIGWTLESNLLTDDVPADFRSASEGACRTLSDRDVVLCFSGGVDSAALGCLLQENDVGFRSVIFDRGPGDTDAVPRGLDVADAMGIDPAVTETSQPLSQEAATAVERRMRREVVKPYTPTHQTFDQYISGDELLLYGYYCDQLFWPQMVDQNRFDPSSYNVFKQAVRRFLRAVPNLQYSDRYISDPFARRAYLSLVLALSDHVNTVLKHTHGVQFPPPRYNVGWYSASEHFQTSSADIDVFRGLLTSGRPNVLPERLTFDGPVGDVQDFDVYDSKRVNRELSHYNSVSELRADGRHAKEFRYFIKGHNTNNQTITFRTPAAGRVEFPMCWGPLQAYFNNEPVSVGRAFDPKREVYDIFESHVGTPYEDVVGEYPQDGSWDPPRHEPLLSKNEDLLVFEESYTQDILGDDAVSQVREFFEWAHEQASMDEQTDGVTDISCSRLLNIELLLDETATNSD